MAGEPIEFWNPFTQSVEQEHVYGEGFLRWIYETYPGRCVLAAWVKRAFFSSWYGRQMDHPKSKSKIEPFIKDYDIDMDDYVVPKGGYRHFNDFFYRTLAQGARPLAESGAVFPADGRHLLISEIGKEAWLYAKGHRFHLETLLCGTGYERTWAGGAALISRLCPVDYHRFHTPVSGVCEAVVDLEGPLYSVSPIALRRSVDYLLVNKRRLIVLDSESHGRVAFIPVGATCVGSIITNVRPGDMISRGDELGYFRFGGSCVITLFERGAINFKEDLHTALGQNLELYDRMGRSLET